MSERSSFIAPATSELDVAFRLTRDALAITNAAGEIVLINPVAERLMGWTRVEAQGRPLSEVFRSFDPQTGALLEDPAAHVLREGAGPASPLLLRSRNGRQISIDANAAPLFDHAGGIRGAILLFHEVNANPEIERQLADAEWRSHTALEMGGAGSWVWDIEHDCVTGDAMLARVFGLSPERCLAGEKIALLFSAIHKEDRPGVAAAIRHAVASGDPYHADFRVRNGDGSFRWIHARGRVEAHPERASRRVIGFLIDTTKSRHAEEALRQSERLFRFLNDLGEATRTLSDPKQIMVATTRLLGRHLRVSRCAYADVQEDSEHFNMQVDYTDGCATVTGRYQLSLFGPRAVADMHGGRTLVIRDLDTELAMDAGAEMFNAIGIKAIVCCPLIKEGALRAMMAVHQNVPREWSPEEIALVQEVVERCWSTIERARAEAEVRERARLSALRADIAARLAFGETIERTLQGCCALLVAEIDAAAARVWLFQSRESVLELQAGAGLPDALPSRIALGDHPIGSIAERRQPCMSNDLPHGTQIDPALVESEKLQAFAGYPLVMEGRLLGVFAVFARHPFSEAALADMASIADGFAQCIERKHAEAALNAGENLKSAILNTSLDGFILMNHEGIIMDWNSAAEGIFGVARTEAIGRLLGDTIVPERLRERHQRGLQHYVATRQARILGRRYELPALRADGSEFPCEISITHIPGVEPPLFAGYLRDISGRKQVEDELRAASVQAKAAAHAVAEAAGRFKLLAEVISLQVWTARLDGALDFANQEYVEYSGAASEQELLGQAWTRFVHPDDLPGALALWEASLGTGERCEVECRLRNGDDAFRWFLVRAEAMRDHESRIAKWFGTNTDIHALKIAQSDAERASRAKDAFLASLSHELRTPLTPVLMTAAALRDDDRLPVEVREQLGMMERNIGLEARLIDDLLDLTRIARGKLHLRLQACDAHSLVRLAVGIVSEEARTKGMSLECEFYARRSTISVDPARFQQVIWNLLRNAVKFTPSGGRVAIRSRDQTDAQGAHRLCIEVIDSGIGIDPATLGEIFLPFEQGGLTGDHRFGGIGLGLAIARAIVELHGGVISAQSGGRNHGATFLIELPGATETAEGAADRGNGFGLAIPALPSLDSKPSLRLLLVEDHEPTLEVLTRLLHRAGHHVVSVNSVGEALKAAAAHAFDLVVSDLGLPDGTGTELMAQLRDTYGLTGVALSGYGMEEDILRSRQAGFGIHLTKPVDFHQLRQAIHALAAG